MLVAPTHWEEKSASHSGEIPRDDEARNRMLFKSFAPLSLNDAMFRLEKISSMRLADVGLADRVL